jgi:sterol 3beta-glucosyltransferase
MHYGIIAIGSRGDVQPFVGLALGLIDRGHRVTLMAHENFKEFVEGYGGIAFHPLPGSIEEMLYSPQGRKVLQSGNMITFMRFVQHVVAEKQSMINREMIAVAEKTDAMITSMVGMIWLDAIADKSGKPWATIQLSFPSTPTKDFPFALLPFFDFPLYNRLTYKLFDFLYTKDYKKQLNTFRQSLGLEPVKGSLLKKLARGNTPNLYAISPALLPRPADWPPRSQLTGFIHLPPHRREKHPIDNIPPDLVRWLDTGDSPIYIGFGSIPVPDPPKFIHILKRLLHETNYRFIFCQGWSHLDDLPQHPRLFTITAINHDWLFPRCRAAIIHGGIGTTAAALKAKLPLIVTSIFADQPFWGKLISSRGFGAHLPFWHWTPEKLLAAIRHTETPEVQKRVSEIGEQMSREDGLQQTIKALEDYVNAFFTAGSSTNSVNQLG